MDERWQTLLRVREVRARLALNEFSHLRRAQSLAGAALEEARLRQARYEEEAIQASAASVGQQGDAVFDVARAQEMLDFAMGARLRAQAAAAPVRRAQLKYDRAREAAEEAGTQYRREAQRKKTVSESWEKKLRSARAASLDREDEARAEERVGGQVARRRIGADESGDQ